MDAVPITKKLIAFGSKKIYLPKFTIALIRTPELSPYHARFLVPLDFSKYDLRDYLYHAYNVKCFNIRSHVKQMPLRDTRKQPRHWFRPESKKYMTVEMEKAFVWPEEPESMEPWGRTAREKVEQEYIRASKKEVGGTMEMKRESMKILREQAKGVLRKKEPFDYPDQEILRKKSAGEELTTKEKERDAELQERHEGVKSMSRLELWERTRPSKAVQGNDSSKFAIKA